MITKSPSGALSPYYYKGGYFHGIHYGSYFSNINALLSIMQKEEEFILKSPEKRRILIDLYETNLDFDLVKKINKHIEKIHIKIIKLAIASDKKSLNILRRSFKKNSILKEIPIYFCTDMEEGKTWLVSDR